MGVGVEGGGGGGEGGGGGGGGGVGGEKQRENEAGGICHEEACFRPTVYVRVCVSDCVCALLCHF